MLKSLSRAFFGSRNDRLIKRLKSKVTEINALEPAMAALSDTELSGKTIEFKERLAKGATVDSLMVEAFAVVREAAKRILGERPYDVQLIGGMVLHEGRIPEMRTGEGKTLVGTLPVYLNALTGKGVHVVTVNDYLANRDGEWMGQIHRFLGLTVGIIQQNMSQEARRAAYACDITYSTNNELGFDYLRDNMVYREADLVQRPYHYAIIDEVDSILIDEARTPLIISGPAEDTTDMYLKVDALIPFLHDEDPKTYVTVDAVVAEFKKDSEKFFSAIETDEATQTVRLSEAGYESFAEKLKEAKLFQKGSLKDAGYASLVKHIEWALQAHLFYHRGSQYTLKFTRGDGEVIAAEGVRLPNGIHQAVEAKEQLKVKTDIERDEKNKSVMLTDSGTEHMEQLLRDAGLLEEGGLYDSHNMPILHHSTMALRAHKAYTKDREYIVQNGKVALIDEFTGRMMEGRRFSEGLHQALEAKERVKVQRENQTLASVTYQNFFRMYPKMAGMTGTALTEAGEFGEIYNLDVVEIPTHRAIARKDFDDEIYRTEREKNAAIVQMVKDAHAKRQPMLVGTTSIEKSEQLSALFKKERIPHNILNARHHEQEASIVAQAGRPGAVTVATNMAGRGTDIKLGGNVDMLVKAQAKGDETPEQLEALTKAVKAQIEKDREIVLNAGGLLVIGTERHESRRIDNQLRGRSGRQGDPGASKFYISLEDDLMRIFGAERIDGVLTRLGIKEGQAIFHPWINTAIERAQKKVEAQHFDARRHILRFDNVMNDQRKVIYEQRRKLMQSDTVSEVVNDMVEEVTLNTIEAHIPADTYKEKWDLAGLNAALKKMTGTDVPVAAWAEEEGVDEQDLADKILAQVQAHWAQKQSDFVSSIQQYPGLLGLAEDSDQAYRTTIAETVFNDRERGLVMEALDRAWKEHLLNLDHLRLGINLRGYAQRDPLNEYKAEAFSLFQAMLEDYRADVVHTLLNLSVATPEQLNQLFAPREEQEMHLTRVDPAAQGAGMDTGAGNVVGFEGERQARQIGTVKKIAVDLNDASTWVNTPRNNQCPCGSGKKYKHCHGAMTATKP